MNIGKGRAPISRRMLTLSLATAIILAAVVGKLARTNAVTLASDSVAFDAGNTSALYSLDQATEALTARVAPAVVYVAVTSRENSNLNKENEDRQQPQDQQQPDQQFFGPGFPFGEFFQGPAQQGPAVEHVLGSGVIISPDGYIVTNNHVVQGTIDIHVMMSDRNVYSAKLIGTDPLTDLAVIKIDAKNLPTVPWADSTQLLPGQMVLAFGSPYGMRSTVTRGIISALNRPNPFDTNRRKPGEFIQTDVAINEGNSGGALVDANGKLIGINTFLISSSGAFSGMGFAIPAEIVRPTVEALIRNGRVHHGSMGVSISDVTPENARFFDVSRAVGAVVTDVTPGSPADRAGLKTGDVITSLDSKPVNDASELQVVVQQHQPGDAVQLGIIRNGNTKTVPVTLESIDQGMASEVAENGAGKQRWGLAMSDLTPSVRSQMQLPDSVRGAVVRDVQPGSPADDAGLQSGDIIVSVDRKPTPTASEASSALAGVPGGQDALVLIWSHDGKTFRVLHPAAG